jgi:hypothetical protein
MHHAQQLDFVVFPAAFAPLQFLNIRHDTGSMNGMNDCITYLKRPTLSCSCVLENGSCHFDSPFTDYD